MKLLVLLTCLVAAQAADRTGTQLDPRPMAADEFPHVATRSPPTSPAVVETVLGALRLRVVPLVDGLDYPWGLAFLPDGGMLVTEHAGRLRIIHNGVLDPWPVAGVPKSGFGPYGIFDVVLHPNFRENGLIYISHCKLTARGTTLAIARAKLEGSTLTGFTDIFVAEAYSGSGERFGGRLAFGADRRLYFSVGDRADERLPQDLTSDAGKVLRLGDDGSIPADNPFVSRPGARPEIFTYGHRNEQGLTLNPSTGRMWETEHGPQGGDELNELQAGKNYGWPLVSWGRAYSGEAIAPWHEGMESPVTAWIPSIGPSSVIVYTGAAFPEWKDNVLVSALAGAQISRLVFTPNGLVGREPLLADLHMRLRTVVQGPDGCLYIMTDGRPGAILRVEPVRRR